VAALHKTLLAFALSLFSASVVLAQTPPNPSSLLKTSAAEETCVVSGMVIQGFDSAPLKNATVQLVSEEHREHTIATRTAIDGHFELRNVPAGLYRLKVSRDGYVEQEFGQKKSTDPGAMFALRAGQKVSELVFKLWRAGVITGHVFNEDGEPMPNVMLNAIRQAYREGKREFQSSAWDRSNDLGQYRIFGLAPGRYYLGAEDQNWNRVIGDMEFNPVTKDAGEKAYAKTYFPATLDLNKASTITVKEGEEIPAVDILMKEVVAYRIRGKVTDLLSKNRGGQNAQVTVLRRGSDAAWGEVGSTNVEKADGTFEIPAVAPGEYSLLAFSFDDGKVHSTQEDLAVGNVDIEGLTVTIGPGVSIPGTVAWEGKPSLEKAGLTVEVSSPEPVFVWGGTAEVDMSNQFTLRDVPEGEFRLTVTGMAKDCYVKEVRFGDALLPDVAFRVVKGSAGPLEIKVSSLGARIEGTVTNEDSLPVAGVWVVAVPEEPKRKQHYLFKSLTTDQYGHFDLRGLAPGKYKLFSWDGVEQDEWEDTDFLKDSEEKGVTIDVKNSDTKAIALKLIHAKNAAATSE
jgi:protocatechuate 3,4-dioxygenase beta subunit